MKTDENSGSFQNIYSKTITKYLPKVGCILKLNSLERTVSSRAATSADIAYALHKVEFDGKSCSPKRGREMFLPTRVYYPN